MTEKNGANGKHQEEDKTDERHLRRGERKIADSQAGPGDLHAGAEGFRHFRVDLFLNACPDRGGWGVKRQLSAEVDDLQQVIAHGAAGLAVGKMVLELALPAELQF